MITAADLLLQNLLVRAAGTPTPLIGFQPPDADWRQRVSGFRVDGDPVACLNVFLADLRENRDLRSTAVAQRIVAGAVIARNAPLRIDLHYLISAWYPVKDSDTVTATKFEHALLSRVLGELAATPLNSDLILSAADALLVPELMRSVDLPTRLLPVDGFPHLGEFWASMGQGQSWRPSCYVVVTIPVAPEPYEAGGIVETILAGIADEMSPTAAPVSEVLAVGGVVRSAAGHAASGAAVELFGLPGGPADGRRDVAIADDDGHFAFSGLAAGSYRLAYSHPAHSIPQPLPVTVPLPSGHIDLVFP